MSAYQSPSDLARAAAAGPVGTRRVLRRARAVVGDGGGSERDGGPSAAPRRDDSVTATGLYEPNEEALARMQEESAFGLRAYFRDVKDHVSRRLGMADNMREMLKSAIPSGRFIARS